MGDQIKIGITSSVDRRKRQIELAIGRKWDDFVAVAWENECYSDRLLVFIGG